MKHFIFILIFFTSCKVIEKPVEVMVPYPVRYDSIVEKLRIDTFEIPILQYQSVVTNQRSHLSTSYSFSDAFLDSCGLLHHTIQNNSVIPSKIIREKVIVNKDKPYKVTVEKIVYKDKMVLVKGFMWWSGLIFWALLFLIILYKIKKFAM